MVVRSTLKSARASPQGVNLPSVDQHDVLFVRWSNVRPHIKPEAAERIEEQGASNSDLGLALADAVVEGNRLGLRGGKAGRL